MSARLTHGRSLIIIIMLIWYFRIYGKHFVYLSLYLSLYDKNNKLKEIIRYILLVPTTHNTGCSL